MSTRRTLDPPATTYPRELTELSRVLAQETAVVGQLGSALLAQRAAVAGDDPDGVETSVRAISTALLTLEETHRARANLLEVLTGDPTLPLSRLESAIAAPLPAWFSETRAALRAAAAATARDASVNQAVLRQAIDAGEAFLQALLSSSDPAPVYLSPERRDGAAASLLLNRTI